MKAVLAYSGGLDTSVILKLMQEKLGVEVITVTVDVGQKDEFEKIEEKAYKFGAVKHYYIDAKEEFANEYVSKAIKANALYEKAYPLATALARPLIVEKLVEVAKKEGANIIAHGCTGKGNDQVRFNLGIKALMPEAEILQPVAEWNLTRDWEMEYAKKHGIPVSDKIYSIDENIWGRSIEGGVLEDPFAEPPEEVWEWTVSPAKAPDEPEYLTIEFENGVPVALNGEKMPLLELVLKVNEIAGKHGVGRIDHIEDRTVGIKSREVYEAPAAVTLIKAHYDLEKLTMTKWLLEFKEFVDSKWSWLVYNGLWYEPLRHALEGFIDEAEKVVNGEVKVKLWKGNAVVVGRHSDNALYDIKVATYEKFSTFDQKLAKGFIELFGMQSVLAYNVMHGAKTVTSISELKETIKEIEKLAS
ncbi:argininosuccinate synthase [Thermococcus chitonophagus]|uniref:Argininosuccinate synthase n=1 Tax=Thermococcus chitonophagus TaxID=54262 RepID=A0A160VQS2_9EURY|nr:argininosuccinate synthase [Thermococcus chitonophagus]ASJ15961.1 argininosuccinate synthase [Thermococcus chitonophagus]CUX77205.1 Argininosuccinate synthase [Thermococcus chitonophagus]